jgi:hypothetical protein
MEIVLISMPGGGSSGRIALKSSPVVGAVVRESGTPVCL